MSMQCVQLGGLGVAALFAVALAAGPVVDRPRTLQEAVEEFNTEAAKDPVGKDREPLTADEVIAAIRMWDRKRWTIDDRTFSTYEQIAKTRTLPDNASLTSLNGCHSCYGYDCVVWWIDLEVTEGNKGYSYRVRDRKIRCSEPKKDADRVL